MAKGNWIKYLLGYAVVYGGYKVVTGGGYGKKKKGSKKKTTPPPADDDVEIVLEGTGWAVNLEAPVQWAVAREGIKYGWQWQPQLEKDFELGVGQSAMIYDSAEEAKQALMDAINLAPLPDPVTGDNEAGGGAPADDDEEPPSGAEGEDAPPPPPPPPSELTSIDYTKMPTFKLGSNGELHQHLKPGIGVHTIVLQRSKKSSPALGQSGVWGSDWYVWQPGILLDKSRVFKTGRAQNHDKALDEAMDFIDGYQFGTGVTSYPSTVYPAGANPLVLPALTQPGQIATSPSCQVAGVGPQYWDLVGDLVEEIVATGQDDPQTILAAVMDTYMPPENQLPHPIEQCEGLLAIKNTMLQRIQNYLDHVLE